MGYVLIIAEKPQAAQRIAEALAEGKVKKVRRGGAHYFEFTKDRKKHICVPAVGHLFVLSPVDDESGWNYPIFSSEWRPTYTKKGLDWTKKYFDNIKGLVKGADEFIDAADFDTEGEVLLFNILRFICGVGDAKRMKFSTLTKDELVRAYQNPLPHISFPTLEAGLTRHRLDWLWGINLTRALTLAMRAQVKRGFQIISSGRVQSPCLKLLLDKELEIRKFRSKPFWQLELHCRVDGEEIVAMHEKENFWEKDEALKILESCKGKDARVKEVKRKKYVQKPPTPFNTTDLQTESYNQFRFSPRQTINIAEGLYQRGFISYPRSSSQKLPPTIDYKKIISAIGTLSQYKKLCEELLKKKELKPREGKKTDPAHICVYATHEVPKLKELNTREKKIYDLIVRRTLAAFANQAVRESMKVILGIDKNNFIVTGRRTIEPGWMKFYGPYVKLDEQILPDLNVGQIVKSVKIELLEKETKPPPRYTQGSIIKELDKRALGTKATRQDILQTLYDRNYIRGKSIEVTKFGETVVSVLKKYCPRILSERLTRHFEQEMDLVFNGKKSREEVIEEAKDVLKEILGDFKKRERAIGKKLLEGFIEARRAQKKIGVCPSCGKELRIVVSRRSGKRFVGCVGYPKCKTSFPLPQSGLITSLGKECGSCNLPIIQVNRKGKRPFRMCINHNCSTKEGWNK